jgi:hypothetical protein
MGVGLLNAASISVAGRAASERLLQARPTGLTASEVANALAEAEDCGARHFTRIEMHRADGRRVHAGRRKALRF